MILDQAQISDIVLNNPGRDRVAKGVKYAKTLRAHIHGKDVDKNLDAMATIDGFELPSLRALRVKYAKPNKDLFERLARPLDKVFSARGGSVYMNLTATAERAAMLLSQNVRNGLSVRKWVESHWLPHLLDDPYGIILMEILPATEAVKAKQEGRAFVYPTYRAIDDIYDYLPAGNRLEYVAFKLTKDDKKAIGITGDQDHFRVIDDANDYIVRRDKSTGADLATILPGFTLPNYFQKVPAIVNSDLADPVTDGGFLSLFDKAIELADEFLLKGSVKTTHDFLHGFPKYAEFVGECGDCRGTGQYEGSKCERCKGSGFRPIGKVSEMRQLAMPASKDDPIITPDQIGAYIVPPRDYHEMAISDMQQLEDKMMVTVWGTQPQQRAAGPQTQQDSPAATATEIVAGFKPQADRLEVVSEMAEKRHKFILDSLIGVQLQIPADVSVNYGRRYLLESPDELWLKYSDARMKKAPQNILDAMLNEYLEALHQTDPVGLQIAKKLIYIEPFVHYSALEVKTLNPAPEDYKSKLYFSEWLATVSEGALLVQDVATLRDALNQYAAGKQLPDPAALPPAA